MNLTNFHLNANYDFYPNDFREVVIFTRNDNRMYTYRKFIKSVYMSDPNAPFKLRDMLDAVIIECVAGDNATLQFAIIRTKKGLYVGNVGKSHRITPTFIDSYSRYMGIPYTLPEIKLKREVKTWLENYYDMVIEPKGELKMYRLFEGKTYSKKVYEEFMVWYKLWKKSDYSYTTVYLRPDFQVIYKGKTITVELECTPHEEKDFFYKLLRIHALGIKTYFLFNDFDKDTYQYHMSLIKRFETITGRSLRYVYAARLSEFIMFGDRAFVNIRQKIK